MQTRELLEECLREGIGKQPTPEVLAAIAVPEPVDDRALARALVSAVARGDVQRLRAGGESPSGSVREGQGARESFTAVPVEVPDASFLGRLKPRSDKSGEQSVDEMTDVTTLLAVLRAGNLLQRRAAAGRLAALVEQFTTDDRRALEVALDQLRDVEIAFEVALCRARLPGAAGRDAQRARKEVAELETQIDQDIVRFWDGDASDEPLTALSGDRRAQLLVHTRELSSLVVDHMSALLEGSSGSPDRRVQRAILSAIRYAGDARLVPALITLLEGRDGHLVMEAARAVSRIEDPRVFPALLAAYERSVVDTERISLGGALGRVGDVRAADYVREQLRNQDEHVIIRAIEAMRTLGSADDAEVVLSFVSAADPVLATKAAHTLARISDARALPELAHFAREKRVGAVCAAVEEAIEQIRARLVLRGEEPPSDTQLVVIEAHQRALATPLATAPMLVRVRGYRHYFSGRLWQLLGSPRRALASFEAAAACRPSWAAPLVVAGMLLASHDDYGQALGLFRRAIDVERHRVERNPLVMRILARCFLRRAEQVERDGRVAIARGLLDEVMALDLRRAPSSLRFEIGRRHEALRLLGAG